MALTESEIAFLRLHKRYFAYSDEEVARQISMNRQAAARIAASIDAVNQLLDSETVEISSINRLQDLEAQNALLIQERDAAELRYRMIEERFAEEHLEGKSLSSYQRLILGLTRRKDGSRYVAISSICSQLHRAGHSLDEKTVRKIMKSAHERLFPEQRPDFDSEFPV